MKRVKKSTVPVPVKTDSRICLGISYFLSEADAQAYAQEIVRRGHTYNGGFFHGMQCGREESRDYLDDELGQLYAVTTA
jgi:hypothetical protein